jgi:hypothetical protein
MPSISNPRTQLLILKICGVVIFVCLIILGIDKYIVRRHEPSTEEQLDRLTEELALEPRDDEASVEELRGLLSAFEEEIGRPNEIGPVLTRTDDAGVLWIFEYKVNQRFLYRPRTTDLSVDMPLLGILMELPRSVALPGWNSDGETAPPQPPFTNEAVERLAAIDDLDMSMTGRLVFFTSRVKTWALKQAIDARVSAEFHPGLLNSALRIEVQRAINVVNRLDAGLPQIAQFYQIDVPKPDIEIPSTAGIFEGLSTLAEDLQQELGAQRALWEQQQAERETALKASMEEAQQERRAVMEAGKAEMEAQRAQRAAEFQESLDAARREREERQEARRAEFEAKRAERMAEFEAKQAEQMAEFQKRLDAIGSTIPDSSAVPEAGAGTTVQ